MQYKLTTVLTRQTLCTTFWRAARSKNEMYFFPNFNVIYKNLSLACAAFWISSPWLDGNLTSPSLSCARWIKMSVSSFEWYLHPIISVYRVPLRIEVDGILVSRAALQGHCVRRHQLDSNNSWGRLLRRNVFDDCNFDKDGL